METGRLFSNSSLSYFIMKIGVIFPIFKAPIDIALFICLNKNGADDLLWSSPEIIFAISSCLHSCRHLPEVLDYSRNY